VVRPSCGELVEQQARLVVALAEQYGGLVAGVIT
jgi:hypothetical protein